MSNVITSVRVAATNPDIDTCPGDGVEYGAQVTYMDPAAQLISVWGYLQLPDGTKQPVICGAFEHPTFGLTAQVFYSWDDGQGGTSGQRAALHAWAAYANPATVEVVAEGAT